MTSSTTHLSSAALSLGNEDEIVMAEIPRRPARRTSYYYYIGSAFALIILAGIMGSMAVSGRFDTNNSNPNGHVAQVKTASKSKDGSTIQYSDVIEAEFNPHWHDLQQALCPKGIPETSYGPTLFQLARNILHISDDDFKAAKEMQHTFQQPHPSHELTYRFYHDQYSSVSYYTSDTESVAYIPTWNQVHPYIQSWMNDVFGQKVIRHVSTEDLFQSSQLPKPQCTVTTIQDPIQQFMIGYNEIEYQRGHWDDATILPPYVSMPHNSPEERQARFHQFVLDIVLEDSRAFHGKLVSHVFSMSRILTELHRVDGWLTVYLPLLNEVEEGNKEASWKTIFPKLIHDSCPIDDDRELPPITSDEGGSHDWSDDPDWFLETAKMVWKEQGRWSQALCALYAIDYACWTLPQGVPQVCRELYASPDFLRTIVG